jgi:ADP-ribose pyrophosphatase YjhB (NUDIX family)
MPDLATSTTWKTLPDPHPHVSVMGLCVDRAGNTLLMHRSNGVRSAKNCWSLPSGLHENGVSLPHQLAAELQEELNLSGDASTAGLLGVYENITHVEQWHWVIAVYAIRVNGFGTMVNKEPDKHDALKVVELFDLWYALDEYVWSPGLKEFLSRLERNPDEGVGGTQLAVKAVVDKWRQETR